MRNMPALWPLGAALVVFAAGCASSEPAASGTPEPAQEPGPAAKQETPAAPDFESVVRPMLVQNCTPCHEGPEAKDGIDVTKVGKDETAKLMKMVSEVEEGKMPPKTAKPLDPETKKKLLEALKASTL